MISTDIDISPNYAIYRDVIRWIGAVSKHLKNPGTAVSVCFEEGERR